MKVVLIKDVQHLGRRGDTVSVSDGYARNFLLPSSLALVAGDTQSQKIVASIQSQQRARKKLQNNSAGLGVRLQSHTFHFRRPATEQGSLYAAVTAADIAKAVSDFLGIGVDAHHITIPAPIKHLGSHRAVCRIADINVSCTLSVTTLTQ